MKKLIYWTPRILALLCILFMSVFALDVFGEPKWFLALFMHLVPSFVLLLVLFIAWKHERLGGILFLILGGAVAVFYHSFVLAIPAGIIGILFLLKKRINS